MSVYSADLLLKHFQTHSLKGFGIENVRNGIVAAGAILHYLKDTEHPNLQHITNIQRIERDDFLWMDKFTIRNLEILSSGREGSNSLLKVLDNTVSPMGARLLRRWIVLPLKDLTKINERLDAVAYFIKEVDLRRQVVTLIRQCGDVERLVSKIPPKKINPREVVHLARGLQMTEQIKQDVPPRADNGYLRRLADGLNGCHYIVEKILREIAPDPPVAVQQRQRYK